MRFAKRWAPALLGLTLATVALTATTAAHAAPPPAEVFYKDADIDAAVLSPSGRRLAVTTAKGAARVGLVVFDLAPGGRIARVAQFAEADVMNVHWVNDERLVFGVTDYSQGSGRPAGAPGLFTVKADGGQVRQLVRRQWKPVVSEGREDRMLSWNHRLLAVPPSRNGKVNEEVLLVEYTYGDERLETPVWLNVVNNTTRSVDYKEPPHTVGWMTDSLGEPRAVFTQFKGRQTVYWQAPGSKTWAPLFEDDWLSQPYHLEGVDDTGTLFVSQPRGAQGVRVLTRYDFATKAPEPKPLVAAPGFDFRGDLITDDAGRTLGIRLTADALTTV